MSNERKLRLIQVAKEFKVGLNTLTDFMQKKGIKSDGSPNTLVEPETYAVLEKEFGGNRNAGSARESIRERISQKQTTVSIEETKAQPRREEQEVVVKSHTIDNRDHLQQPRILGKIDLSPKPKQQPAPAPAPAPVAKPEPKPEPKPAPAPAVEPKPEVKPEPAPRAETPAPETKPQPAPAPAPKTEEPKAAEPERKDTTFRPETTILTGPKVLGTMDVTGMVPGGKHKRKRLQKEKVDVNRAQQQKSGKGGGQNNGQGGKPGSGNGGNNANQPKPGEGRKNKNKNKAPKPVVRPEVSDEEVSKQVKDTLARLTAKGAKNKGAKYRKEKRELVAERMNEEFEREEMERSTLKVTEFVTVSELATMMNVSVTQVITACMNLGLMVSINQRLDAEAARW